MLNDDHIINKWWDDMVDEMKKHQERIFIDQANIPSFIAMESFSVSSDEIKKGDFLSIDENGYVFKKENIKMNKNKLKPGMIITLKNGDARRIVYKFGRNMLERPNGEISVSLAYYDDDLKWKYRNQYMFDIDKVQIMDNEWCVNSDQYIIKIKTIWERKSPEVELKINGKEIELAEECKKGILDAIR